MLPNVGAGEIVLLLLVALVLFGPSRLPDMARSLGKGIREFKEAASGLDRPEAPLPTAVDPPAPAPEDARPGDPV
jgi:sec-independent protein translocase protein TatA